MTTDTHVILVCGGRHYNDWSSMCDSLDEDLELWGDDLVILSGAASGADLLAWRWAVEHDVFWVLHSADWYGLGFRAGPFRNLAMALQWQPNEVRAFPGGRGTEDMCRVALRRGIHLTRVP